MYLRYRLARVREVGAGCTWSVFAVRTVAIVAVLDGSHVTRFCSRMRTLRQYEVERESKSGYQGACCSDDCVPATAPHSDDRMWLDTAGGRRHFILTHNRLGRLRTVQGSRFDTLYGFPARLGPFGAIASLDFCREQMGKPIPAALSPEQSDSYVVRRRTSPRVAWRLPSLAPRLAP